MDYNAAQDLKNDLMQFIGSQQIFALGGILKNHACLTEGTKYLAEKAQCFWLMTDIACVAIFDNWDKDLYICKLKQQESGIWQLVITGRNPNPMLEDDVVIHQQEYPASDFPFPEFTLYIDWVDPNKTWLLMLPSER